MQRKAVLRDVGSRGARERVTQASRAAAAWSAGRGGRVPSTTQAVRVEPVLETVAETDERIAREAFAALDALEQEARPERLELEVRRHRACRGRRRCRTKVVVTHGSSVAGTRGRTTKNPSHGGSRRWVLESCERVLNASGPTPRSGATTSEGSLSGARSSRVAVSTATPGASRKRRPRGAVSASRCVDCCALPDTSRPSTRLLHRPTSAAYRSTRIDERVPTPPGAATSRTHPRSRRCTERRHRRASTTACRCTGCATGRCRFRSSSPRRRARRCATSTATNTPTSVSATPARCSATRRAPVAEAIARQAGQGPHLHAADRRRARGRPAARRALRPAALAGRDDRDRRQPLRAARRARRHRPAEVLVFNGCYHGTVDETLRAARRRPRRRTGRACSARRPT